jgi:hypothetical protein
MLIFFLARPCVATQDNAFEDALRQLADRVAAISNLHGPVRLEIQQDADLVVNIGTDWQDMLRSELDKRHLNTTVEASAPLLRVALSETPTQIVLAANVRLADRDEVRLISFARAALRTADAPVVPVRVERKLIFESDDKILDAAWLPAGPDSGIALLTYRSGEWTALRLNAGGEIIQTIALPLETAHASRDPHGELNAQGNEEEVQLPGKSCKFSWAAAGDVKCHASKPIWRDAAILAPPCDAGQWKLVANGKDWTTAEVLQVVPQGAVRNGSAPLLADFPGPILNVNQRETSSSALVTTRNLRTGNYEVYKITLACGN